MVSEVRLAPLVDRSSRSEEGSQGQSEPLFSSRSSLSAAEILDDLRSAGSAVPEVQRAEETSGDSTREF